MNIIHLNRKKLVIVTTLLVIFDQFTKSLALSYAPKGSFIIIPKLINYNLVKNPGASFGILSSVPLFLLLISILVSFILIILILQDSLSSPNQRFCVSILLAGTLGNCIDRWSLGYVIDFIQLIPIQFPVFNFADIYINLAVLIILLDKFFPTSKPNY